MQTFHASFKHLSSNFHITDSKKQTASPLYASEVFLLLYVTLEVAIWPNAM